MTRAIDRLIVAGSLDPSRRDRSRSLIGWTLDRLGADLDQERPRAPGARRRSSSASTAAAEATQAASPEREQLDAVRARRGGRAGRRVRAAAAPGRAGARAGAHPSPLVQRARALRALPVSLLRRAHRRPAPDEDAGRGGGAAGLARPRSATPCTCSSRRAQAAEAAGARLAAPAYAHALDEDVERVSALVAAWRESVLAADLAGLAGIRPRAAVRVRARRRAAPRALRPLLAPGRARAGRRLQDEPARRT